MVLEFSARGLARKVSPSYTHSHTSTLFTHCHITTCRPGGCCLHTWLGAFTLWLRPFHTCTTQPPPRDVSSICLQKTCQFASGNLSNQHFPLARIAYQCPSLRPVIAISHRHLSGWLHPSDPSLSTPHPHPQPSSFLLRSLGRMNDRINLLPRKWLITQHFNAALPSVLTRLADFFPQNHPPSRVK